MANLIGTENNDYLIGTQKSDNIAALGGDDTVEGGNGNDSILGENGNDSILGENGNDSILGGSGDDFIEGGNGSDSIYGASSDNLGLGEKDTLSGGLAKDLFVIGNEFEISYDDGNPTTDGSDDLAIITDLIPNLDQIQLQGKYSDYRLEVLDGNTIIYLVKPDSEADEIIGIIEGVEGLDLESDTFIYEDDSEPEVPGITVIETEGSTEVEENGATDTYSIVLNTQPTADVIINLEPDQQVTTDKTILVFTPDNWESPQTVIVTAVDDTEEEGEHTGKISHTVTSVDENYDSFYLNVAIADNDNNQEPDPIIGTSDDDTLVGTEGDDRIRGKSGKDTLNGLNGNDILNGGPGVDEMFGGQGDDKYLVVPGSDKVIEAADEGKDRVVTARTNYTLPENVEELILQGAENLEGTGNNLDNLIRGNDGDNILIGNDGNDILLGVQGNDVLIGGLGKDKFTFRNPTQGVDTINDFISETDKIKISAQEFGEELTIGKLNDELFVLGSTAEDEGDRFIYNSEGALFYDEDGIGDIAQIQIATLLNAPTLEAKDIVIF